MPPNWMVQAVSMAIYVQVLGAFVWLFVVLLLERSKRGTQQRVRQVESQLVDLRERIEDICETLADLSGKTASDETDPAVQSPIGIERLTDGDQWGEDNRTNSEVAAAVDASLQSLLPSDELGEDPTDAHWECTGCRLAFPLEAASFHQRCKKCGGLIELVTYPNGHPFRHLPAAGAK